VFQSRGQLESVASCLPSLTFRPPTRKCLVVVPSNGIRGRMLLTHTPSSDSASLLLSLFIFVVTQTRQRSHPVSRDNVSNPHPPRPLDSVGALDFGVTGNNNVCVSVSDCECLGHHVSRGHAQLFILSYIVCFCSPSLCHGTSSSCMSRGSLVLRPLLGSSRVGGGARVPQGVHKKNI
jgi:hypothetical protein